MGVKHWFLYLIRALNLDETEIVYTDLPFADPFQKKCLTSRITNIKNAIPERILLLLNELSKSSSVSRNTSTLFYSSLFTCHIVRMIRHVSRDSNKRCILPNSHSHWLLRAERLPGLSSLRAYNKAGNCGSF